MGRTVLFTDDYDGSPNATERRFTIGGAHYVVDLTDDNYAQMLQAIEPWRSVSRIERKNSFKLDQSERQSIREWAEANGMPLKERGRFPHSVVQAYFDAFDDNSTD